SFGGEPFTVPIADSIDDNARTYWETLDQNNRISLLVKYIDTETNKTDFRIINKHSS
ncbi:MAG: inosine monophosphate cyclohydrolase, partial [Fibrobacter sp.]|nr:inosine monophosphate cyclohydrolase [Fibrobacter sp.]